MTPRAGLLALLALAAPLAAQDATGRWSLQVRGPVEVDRGDLRIAAGRARLLLESQDSSWVELGALTLVGDQVSFRTPEGRRFVGTLAGDEIAGTVSDSGGLAFPWRAFRIQPGTERWPVRPRLVVRQLIVGPPPSAAWIPADWRAAVPPIQSLVAEHATLAAAAGMPVVGMAGVAARASAAALGFDADARRLAEGVLGEIARSPAADERFRALFLGRAGDWRLDLHTVAWQAARSQVAAETLLPGPLARLLAVLGLATAPGDEAGLREAVWTYWQRSTEDRSVLDRITGAEDPEVARAAGGLRALLGGYDLAEAWWIEAVRWLMTARWIAVDGDWRSPAGLVATFWQSEELPLPALEVRHFGAPQAVPIIGAAELGDRLLRGANAVGDEFLLRAGAFALALDGWRGLEFVESTPLRLEVGEETLVLASPASVARSRLGGFLAARDGIAIESGIVPLFAVGTVIHEWQHLLLEGARLTGPGAPGLREESWGLRLLGGDPWLAEGAAEWMTEAILAPASGTLAGLRLLEAEKRLAIGTRAPDDPHTLGYLLVRAVAARLDDPGLLRRLLVASVHDPRAIAAVSGFGGTGAAPPVRPPDLIVIPEVRYTMDGGVADGATRRLILPRTPSEP